MKPIFLLTTIMFFISMLTTPVIVPEKGINAQQKKADKAYTPKPGTPERKAIMDALRERRQSPDAIFVVNYLKVKDGWAWIEVSPQSKDGKSHFEEESWLMQKINGKWKAVDARTSGKDCEEDPDCSDNKRFFKKLKEKYPLMPIDIFSF